MGGGVDVKTRRSEAFYCFVSSVKYEKELKGRRLKKRPVAYVNETCFNLQPLLLLFFPVGYLKFFFFFPPVATAPL